MNFIDLDLDKVLFAIASTENGTYTQTRKSNDGRANNGKNLTTASRSLGGKNAHKNGTAHEFTPDEARAAGRIGGKKSNKRSRQQEETN